LSLNSWINTPHSPTPNQHVFLVLNFFNLAILIGENLKKIVQIQKKMLTQKKIAKKFEITNFKEKRLLLMSKSLKVISIIPTLNT